MRKAVLASENKKRSAAPASDRSVPVRFSSAEGLLLLPNGETPAKQAKAPVKKKPFPG